MDNQAIRFEIFYCGVAEQDERRAPELDDDFGGALRQAFADTLADPEFIAEAAKTQLEIEPMTGGEIAKMLAKAYAAPQGVVERAAELVYPGAPKAQ